MDTINIARADEILQRATARAAELGANVSIALVDAGAHLKLFHRMDGAILGSVDVSQRKARTSVLFRAESGDFGQLLNDEQLLGMELSNGGLAGFHGGVPIYEKRQLIGAIGISGGTAEQDREIARASI